MWLLWLGVACWTGLLELTGITCTLSHDTAENIKASQATRWTQASLHSKADFKAWMHLKLNSSWVFRGERIASGMTVVTHALQAGFPRQCWTLFSSWESISWAWCVCNDMLFQRIHKESRLRQEAHHVVPEWSVTAVALVSLRLC